MREHWGSRLGFILAAAGSAIGLGTLWKFPYVTGDNGGGLFVLIYLLFLLLIGTPLFVGELILGRKAQRGAVGIFAEFSGEMSGWKSIGWLSVISALLILSFYIVVSGWGLNYLLLSLNHFTQGRTSEEILEVFQLTSTSGDISLFWAGIFLLLTFGVVYRGIRKGIEYWSRILMILLFVMLIGLTAYSFTLEGFGKAVSFLFSPRVADFKPSGILEALGLSLFTLSLAQGVILTYGSYLRGEEDLPKMSLTVAVMVLVTSLLVVLMIFPVIFTFDLPPKEGPGLVFKTLPVLFAVLPGSMIVSTLFFFLFTFTALTSAVALLEVVVANFIDLRQWSRHKAVLFAAIVTFVIALPCIFAGSGQIFGQWSLMYGHNFLETVDLLVSTWLLPVGGLLTAIYLGWHLDRSFVKTEFLSGTTLGSLFGLWFFLIRWAIPIATVLIILQKGGLINLDKLVGLQYR